MWQKDKKGNHTLMNNNFIDEIDEFNKMLYMHLNEHRIFQYWKKVIFNIFTRMILNSYLT